MCCGGAGDQGAMGLDTADRIVDGRDVSNAGERVVADEGTFVYYAHLSIYEFARPFVQGKRVWDAGCGTGYGSVHLARGGAASVLACDASEDAITFCRRRYGGEPGVEFRVMDLGAPLPLADGSFDVIYSSNVMEHIAAIDVFLSECRRVLAPGGMLIAAVPPIVTPEALRENIRNVHHVTNLTPLGWHTKIGRYFGAVDCHRHAATGRFADPRRIQAELAAGPGETTVRESDFTFPACTLDELNTRTDNITAIFLAREPRAAALPESDAERLPANWHLGTIVSRVVQAERTESWRAGYEAALGLLGPPPGAPAGSPAEREAALLARVAAAETQLAAMRTSTSWRVTAPLRALARRLRGGRPGR